MPDALTGAGQDWTGSPPLVSYVSTFVLLGYCHNLRVLQAKKTKSTSGKATIRMETDRSMFGRGLGMQLTGFISNIIFKYFFPQGLIFLFSLYPEIFYIITQRSCSASKSL